MRLLVTVSEMAELVCHASNHNLQVVGGGGVGRSWGRRGME